MKKICAVILAVLCVLSVMSMSLSASAITMWRRGDADADDEVTVTDVTVIQRKLAFMEVEEFRSQAADVDKSGEVDISDATWIQRFLAQQGNPNKIDELFDPYELPFIPKN